MMQRRQPIVSSAFYVLATLLALASQLAIAQSNKPEWVSDAEDALIGKWTNDGEGSLPVDQFQIRLERDVLKIVLAEAESSDDPADQLYLLSSRDDQDTAVAYASHQDKSMDMHLTLKLRDDAVHVELIEIVKNASGAVNRISNATFTRATDAELDSKSDAKKMADKKDPSATKNSARTAAKQKPKATPKTGKIVGQIETRSTMRGTLGLTPAPEKMSPAEGTIAVAGANPRFDFANLPEGEYTLSFKGTVNGSTKSIVWKGLKIDVAGGSPSLTLSLRGDER